MRRPCVHTPRVTARSLWGSAFHRGRARCRPAADPLPDGLSPEAPDPRLGAEAGAEQAYSGGAAQPAPALEVDGIADLAPVTGGADANALPPCRRARSRIHRPRFRCVCD